MMRERSGWRDWIRTIGPAEDPAVVVASALVCVAFPLGESSGADMSPSRNLLSRGTDGSNPASSSGESSANLISST